MVFVIGETVGPYQILEQLGQGGMATVYKAYHPALDRFVAIKVLHSAFLEDESFLSRFKREAKVVAQLDHPNIVPIYDFAEEKKQPYLIMKYIQGETLKARLLTRRVSLEEILEIAEKIGSALSYAHKKHIVHRDVKPSNVLFSLEGQIYLADFGLARIAQSSGSTLTSEQMIGTPQYISPEQALSRPDLDFRTDIYSFGVMMYEMLVGKVPFNADTPFAIVHDHIYTPLPLPRTINPHISEETECVLLKALSKRPEDRYENITSFAQALAKALAAGHVGPLRSESTPMSTLKSKKLEDQGTLPPQIPPAGKPGASPSGNDIQATQVQVSAPVQTKKESRKALGWTAGVVGSLIVCGVLFMLLLRPLQTWLRNVQSAGLQTAEALTAGQGVLPTKTVQEGFWQSQALDALAAYDENTLEQYITGFTESGQAWFNDDGVNQTRAFNFFYERKAWVLAGLVIKQPTPAFRQAYADSDPKIHEVFFKAASLDMRYADLLFTEEFKNSILPVQVGYYRYNFLRGKLSRDAIFEKIQGIQNNLDSYAQYPEVDLLLIEYYEKYEPEKVDSIINRILNDTSGFYAPWIMDLAKEKTRL